MIPLLTLSLADALALLVISVSEAGGVPVSLSSTYYALDRDGWIFQCLCAFAAAMLLPAWIELSRPGLEWMAFLACLGMLFVAAAPAFRLRLEGIVHYTSAGVCCIAALGWQVAEGLWDVTLWFALIFGTLCLMKRKQWCWWLEAAVIASVYANLFRLIF